MALYSSVHSLNTSLGSVHEIVAKELATGIFSEAKNKYKLPTGVGEAAKAKIDEIVGTLASGGEFPRERINKVLKESASQGPEAEAGSTKVDLYLRDESGCVHLFDLKTPRPNKKAFEGHKRVILEWAAAHYRAEPDVEVETLIGMPYNPHHPEPYDPWTLKGMLEYGREVKVAEEFWNFVGDGDCYDDLLDCFEEAGDILREEIDAKFAEFTQ